MIMYDIVAWTKRIYEVKHFNDVSVHPFILYILPSILLSVNNYYTILLVCKKRTSKFKLSKRQNLE